MDFWYGLRVKAVLPEADILVTNTFWLPWMERRESRGRLYVHVARYPKGQMRLYRRAVLQTVSEPIREAILAEDPTAADRVRVIPYPLADRYLLSQVPKGEEAALYTGRVHPEKGVHLLIEAFARLSPKQRGNWRLKIVGPWEIAFGGGGEDYLKQLQAAAAPLGNNVEFVGRVFDEAKLIQHYASARIFVYPSLAERGETFGLAVLEGMAAGCAPIVSALGCFQDFVRNGKNGRVFNHRDSDPVGALSRELADLFANETATASLRQQAWSDARHYTMNTVASQFLEDFERLRQQA
ncbi:glycosyltransferase family 1 protein [Opitutaceae bacterium EW11]|nr:glycosyltransferase family 1 protein [Opitutaceae bacterium EW11]